MEKILRSNWLSLLIISGAFLSALSLSSFLPAMIPSHYDVRGNPDQYGNKYFVLSLLPAINILVVVLLSYLPDISPSGFEMPNSRQLIGRLNLAVTVLLTTIYFGIVLDGLNPNKGYFLRMMAPAFSLFMICAGNYFGKLERNFFIGIRLPWTLASETNWRATHRFSGRVWVIAGVLGLVFSFTDVPGWTAIGLLIAASLISTIYSFYFYLKNERTKST